MLSRLAGRSSCCLRRPAAAAQHSQLSHGATPFHSAPPRLVPLSATGLRARCFIHSYGRLNVAAAAAAQEEAPASTAPEESSDAAEPSEAASGEEEVEFEVPEHVMERNRQLADRLRGKLILAPLTKGGNLPFRRLCVDFGCEVTMSEMAFARMLVK